MDYLLHPGCGDHGVEDRVRGTCALLEVELHSHRPEEDWLYGLGRVAPLKRGKKVGDLVLSSRKVQQILWDRTSPGGPGITTAPDRRSLSLLKNAGLDAKPGPDPLFLVERHLRRGAGAFRQETAALCGWPGLSWGQMQELTTSLLGLGRWQVALIPYRARDPGYHRLLTKGRPEDRLLPRPDGPSPELRGDISLCAFVVGSPPAVMAAWSCGVPGLCIGFSPRAVGLAMELFGRWEEAVLPIASLSQAGDLRLAIRCFLSVMDGQRQALETAVPLRRAQAKGWDVDKMI